VPMRLIGLAVLVAICLVALLPAEAQRSEKVYRVGILHPRPAEGIAWLEAFRRGLAELGYREGQNLILEYRWVDREPGRFRELAGELVHLKVDLIFTSSTPGALAAKGATTTIPVVFVGVGDPVGAGVVASLARPGSNITGITHIAVELTGKTLSLLKDLVPAVSRVAVLGSSVNPTTALKLRGLDAAAHSLGMRLQMVDVRSVKDLEKAFSEITREKLFSRLHEELPYRSTVETEQWKELKDGSTRIEQTIYVERESQRKIVLGKGGQTIKAIGAEARREIATVIEQPVHLFLFVKVREGWGDDPERYREMGLEFPKD